jgi:hypothetical protein
MQEHAGDGGSAAPAILPQWCLMAMGNTWSQAKDSTWNYYGPEGKLPKWSATGMASCMASNGLLSDGAVAERRTA